MAESRPRLDLLVEVAPVPKRGQHDRPSHERQEEGGSGHATCATSRHKLTRRCVCKLKHGHAASGAG
eukprot:5325977-Pleurochrysis_carterae.AAC.2